MLKWNWADEPQMGARSSGRPSSCHIYYRYMWPFRRRRSPEPDAVVSEHWETTFGLRGHARFRDEQTREYSVRIRNRLLTLSLERQNLFAWVDDPLYRYRDFALEASISFDEMNGYSAAGFLFRKANEETYYYFLVSTRRHFRFDVVFNGNPIELIGWTELSGPRETPVQIRIVANGDRFTFCVDDAWVAEIDDETIEAGGLAFAAQNYDEKERAAVMLHHLAVDSRPLAVEAHHVRWREAIPVAPDARTRLAESLYRQRSFTGALIQIRKALKHRQPTADALFLLAECQTNLGLYEPALENIDKTLSLDAGRREAIQERANLLYLLGRYLELEAYLSGMIEGSDSSTLWNLYGHATFSIGRYGDAAAAYEHAALLEPAMPLFHINAGRAHERLGQRPEALSSYLTAGKLLARQEAFEELAAVLTAITAIDESNADGRALRGLLAFTKSDFAAAKELFAPLVSEGYAEASVAYMLGVILSSEGERRRALELFESAAAREPEYALYWFRVAETRYLLGIDPAEALRKALDLSPEDTWTLNLAGQIKLESGQVSEAAELLSKAHAAAPGEDEITINYSEALYRQGRTEESLALLAGRDTLAVQNARGNLLTRVGRSEEALEAYERAHSLDRDDPVVLENLAAVCIELDLVNRAEELLGRLAETAPSASVLNKMGNLALIEGDRVRAEAAFRQAFELLGLGDPHTELTIAERQRLAAGGELRETAAEIEANLAELYIMWGRYERARGCVERLRAYAPSARVRKIADRIRLSTEVHLSCATCGREWWAPREVDVPRHIRLHGEPLPDSPAGRCGRCGKVYCVGCAQNHLRDGRFICPDCDEKLTLNDPTLRYLALKSLELSEHRPT